MGHSIIDSREIMDIMLDDSNTYNDNPEEDIYISKGSYVVNFISHNIEPFRAFNSNPTRTNLRIIYDNFTRCAHDACIVLKAEYYGKTFLLSGDASKKVFNRLIGKNIDISADYLKVPHHGSKNNINKDILEKINPQVAIISHDNHRFGRATDPHPSKVVLDMLKRKNIKIMLTNDVWKHDELYLKKADCLGDDLVEIL